MYLAVNPASLLNTFPLGLTCSIYSKKGVFLRLRFHTLGYLPRFFQIFSKNPAHAYIVFIFCNAPFFHLSRFYIQGPLCGNRCAVTVILLSHTLLLFLKFSCNLKTILLFFVSLYKNDLLRVSPVTYTGLCLPLTVIFMKSSFFACFVRRSYRRGCYCFTDCVFIFQVCAPTILSE